MAYRGYEKPDPFWMVVDYERECKERGCLEFEDEYISDEDYYQKMKKILTAAPFIGVPPDPTMLVPRVFLGTQANAESLSLLRRHRISHILNCSGKPRPLWLNRGDAKKHEFKYLELDADDAEYYNITHVFSQAHSFIDHGRAVGNVLIYCSGVSRSGAVAISYMVKDGRPLLQATQELKTDRRVVLCNDGFMQHLVVYARRINGLDPDLRAIPAPKYGRALDRVRIMTAHYPTVM